jgi:hypothetical protein
MQVCYVYRRETPSFKAGISGGTCRVSEVCDTVHDRDVNAALNILAVGRGRLVGGTPSCCDLGILVL